MVKGVIGFSFPFSIVCPMEKCSFIGGRTEGCCNKRLGQSMRRWDVHGDESSVRCRLRGLTVMTARGSGNPSGAHHEFEADGFTTPG